MGGNLRKNPVVGFFRRTSGNDTEILVCLCMSVPMTAVRISPKLLLVFPQNNLCCDFIIVLIDPRNRKRRTGFPSVNRR